MQGTKTGCAGIMSLSDQRDVVVMQQRCQIVIGLQVKLEWSAIIRLIWARQVNVLDYGHLPTQIQPHFNLSRKFSQIRKFPFFCTEIFSNQETPSFF